jgi:SH3-like domain-containing protein
MFRILIYLSTLFFFFTNSHAQNEYYLTLRNDKVNLRQGPSFEHPIKLIYKKKYLPVLIIDKSYNFRKIIDHENNSGWIHISQLSKKKYALNNKNKSIIFKKPSEYSQPLAFVKKGRLLLIKKCKKEWCKIKTSKYVGWMKKKNLKGRL